MTVTETGLRRHAFHLVTTGRQELEDVLAIVRSLEPGMVDAIHIREKMRTAREHLAWYSAITAAAGGTLVFVNDRVDAAAAVQAPGVQLGYTSVPIAAARRMLPDGTLIGRSVHGTAEAQEAEADGADYVLFGHVYETASKQGLAGRGVDELAGVVRSVSIPVLAIGGIGPAQVEEVLGTGCAGIAVLSSVFLHERPARQAERYRFALDTCTATPKHERTEARESFLRLLNPTTRRSE